MPYIVPAYNPDPQVKPQYPCAVDWNHPLSSGLEFCALMNSTGQLIDIGPAQAHGTLTNGAAYDSTQKGLAIKFDGNNDHIVCANSSRIDNLINFTWLAWIFPTGYGLNNKAYIIHKGSLTALGKILLLNNAETNAPALQFMVSTTSIDPISVFSDANAIPLNSWSCVAVTYRWILDTSVPILYHNGRRISITADTSSGTELSEAGVPLVIGNRLSDLIRGYQGYIGAVLIYQRDLTPSEIQQLYLEPYAFIRPVVPHPYWIPDPPEIYYRSPMPTFRPFSW